MKKRIEKVVERIGRSASRLTIGRKYLVHSETETDYLIIDNNGDEDLWDKNGFKVVSEKEVLEFDIEELKCYCRITDLKDRTLGSTIRVLKFDADIKLSDYNVKVIATPKDSPYESKSKEELIEIIKELKSKE